MDKVILNQNGFKKPSAVTNNHPPDLSYGEKFIQDNVYYSLKAKVLAVGIFLFFFFENGALGIIPKQYYMVYRSIRISDFILYALVIYSLFCYKEYKELFHSKSFIIACFPVHASAEKERSGIYDKVVFPCCRFCKHIIYIQRNYRNRTLAGHPDYFAGSSG